MNKTIFFCHCEHFEHHFLLSYDEEEPGTVYLCVSLSDNLSFPRRLWLGIRYILGYRSRYGMFSEFLLTTKELDKLHKNLGNILSIGRADVPN